jgi:hypothetical protein
MGHSPSSHIHPDHIGTQCRLSPRGRGGTNRADAVDERQGRVAVPGDLAGERDAAAGEGGHNFPPIALDNLSKA